MGGPLDGAVLPDQPVTEDPGAYMAVPHEVRRAIYGPRPGKDPTVGDSSADGTESCLDL